MKITNQYVLFAGDEYYPQPGMEDVKKTDSDLDELVTYAKGRSVAGSIEWWHIFDRKSGKIVAGDDSYCQCCMKKRFGPNLEKFCDDCQLKALRALVNDIALFTKGKNNEVAQEIGAYLEEKLSRILDDSEPTPSGERKTTSTDRPAG